MTLRELIGELNKIVENETFDARVDMEIGMHDEDGKRIGATSFDIASVRYDKENEVVYICDEENET